MTGLDFHAPMHFVARISSRASQLPPRLLCEANVLRPPELQHAVQRGDSNGLAPVSSWSRQQAEKRIRVAASALFENRADNKLARMSVVMLHLKTVALVSSPCLNGAITPQHTVVVLKCALNIEEFDHY
jgi:hypothetical protein